MAYGKLRIDSVESSTRTINVDDISLRTEIVNADINANAEIAVSKLADGEARQLLQTDSAGTGVEWASNIDVPGTLDVTGVATFDSSVSIAGDLLVSGTTVNIDAQNLVVEDKNIIIGDTSTPTNTTADAGGITLKGDTDKTLTWLNSTSSWTSSEHFDLANGKSYQINNTEVLSSTSLGSGVTGSSLTSVGTINSGTWQGSAIADTYLGTISTAGKVSNSATTAASTNTAGAIVVRDASGNFSAGTITANLTGTASAIADNTVTSAKIVDGSIVNGDINASAAIDPSKISGTAVITSDSRLSDTRTPTDNTVSTAKLVDGAVTSAKIADGTIVNGDVNDSAGIAGTKISPDFGSQTVQTTGIVSHALGTASAPTVTFTGDTNTGIYSPGADQLAISTSGSERIRIGANGQIGLSGANYGTSGQVLTSAGPGAAPTWTTPSAGNTDKIEEGNSSAEVIDTGTGQFVVTTDGTQRLRIREYGKLDYYTEGNFVSLTTSTSGPIVIGNYSGYGFNSGTTGWFIYANGDMYNQTGTYSSFSDIKLKENIVDAGSQWDDLKALRVRKYNLKEGETHTQIGLIAQEVELVSPGLVDDLRDLDKDGNELDTVTKAVKYSVLYMKAIKALQEAMERIETLEAKVAALEGL